MKQAYFGRGLFELPIEEAKQGDVINDGLTSTLTMDADQSARAMDQVYFFKAYFSGFTFSVIDEVPSEIAMVSLRKVAASAKWNRHRTSDALAVISIGWLQVDNHCPNAPHPVAFCPDESAMDTEGDSAANEADDIPFLNVGLTFAPRHTSGITCLKGVTIEPRDMALAVDLAFVMRMQRFLIGIQTQISGQGGPIDKLGGEALYKFPDLAKLFNARSRASAGSNAKLYFEGLAILPCNVRLSVAPTRALKNDISK